MNLFNIAGLPFVPPHEAVAINYQENRIALQ
jgi:hypothetical protein